MAPCPTAHRGRIRPGIAGSPHNATQASPRSYDRRLGFLVRCPAKLRRAGIPSGLEWPYRPSKCRPSFGRRSPGRIGDAVEACPQSLGAVVARVAARRSRQSPCGRGAFQAAASGESASASRIPTIVDRIGIVEVRKDIIPLSQRCQYGELAMKIPAIGQQHESRRSHQSPMRCAAEPSRPARGLSLAAQSPHGRERVPRG